MSWLNLQTEVTAEFAELSGHDVASPAAIRQALRDLDRRLRWDESRHAQFELYKPSRSPLTGRRRWGKTERTRRRHRAIQRWLDMREAERRLALVPAAMVTETRGLVSSRELDRAAANERDSQRRGPEPVWWTP